MLNIKYFDCPRILQDFILTNMHICTFKEIHVLSTAFYKAERVI